MKKILLSCFLLFTFFISNAQISLQQGDATGSDSQNKSAPATPATEMLAANFGPKTKINPNLCGKVLPTVTGDLDAGITAPVATAYRFRVKETATGIEQILESQNAFTQLSNLTNYAYNTTYTIDVAVFSDGAWGDYGKACDVTSAAPSAQLALSVCGATLNANGDIHADNVPLATAYRFRVKQGSNEQILESATASVQLSSLTNYAGNNTYTIDVSAHVGGNWTPYGIACNVTAAAVTTQVRANLCGTVLTNITGEIYADPFLNATDYRFRVRQGSNEQILEIAASIGFVRLSQLSNYTYNTTYTIDVSANVGGNWTAYGTACNVTSIATPVTQVSANQCGKVLTTMDGEVYAEGIPTASVYRFRIKQGSNEQILEIASPVSFIRLGNLTSYTYAYNTTYTVDISANVGGNWTPYGAACNVTSAAPLTQLALNVCGTTLNTNGDIHADYLPTATAYRFRVKQGSNEQVLESTTLNAQLINLSFFAGNTTYTIDVSANIAGTWTPYGTACNVTSAPLITKVRANQCGTVLTTMDGEVYTDGISTASAYRFRIKQGSNEQVLEIAAPVSFIRLGNLTSYTYTYNTTYTVDVSANVGGNWTVYGAACNVTSAAPLTQLALNVCGTTLNTNGDIHADYLPTATAYRFRVKQGSNEQVLESTTLNANLTNLSFFAGNTTYTIDVSANIAGAWTPYGTACNVTTAPLITKVAANLCGTVLTNMTGEIRADQLSIATGYRFRVKQGSNEQILESATASVLLSNLSFFAGNTTYTIDVAVKVNGNWTAYGTACSVTTAPLITQVRADLCGTVLATKDGDVYPDGVPNATDYRFRIKQGSNEQVLQIAAGIGFIRLRNLTSYSYTYNTTYTIDVSAKVAGNWTDYGAACNVTSAVPVTQVSASQCGKVLTTMDGEVYADQLATATVYRYRIKQGSNEQILEVPTPVLFIRLGNLTSYAYAYNTTYTVDVSANIAGNWTPYGAACNVTSAAPVTQLSQNVCGTTLSANGDIHADQLLLATAYRFRVKQGNNEQILESATLNAQLRNLTNYAGNTTYTIDVSASIAGTWTPYGAACNVTTPPRIINISSTSPAGNYGIGSVIPIQVTFSGNVRVTGTPVLILNSGGTATYVSGSRSSILVFNYTVKAGDHAEDLDYNANNSLQLSGASIADANRNNAYLNLPDPGNAGSLAANNDLVIDGIVPTLSNITILSNNSNTELAKTGDAVTLNFTSVESIMDPVVTIAGHPVMVSHSRSAGGAGINAMSNNDWTAVYTMTDGDAEGNISFSIAFSDKAGNAGTNVTTTTNGSSITFDRTNPTLTAAGIASDNNNSAMAKTGDIVTVNFTSSETVAAPEVTIAGHVIGASHAASPLSLSINAIPNNNWTATYTMTDGDTEGNIPFSIAFKDRAGNTGTSVTAATNSSNVLFDKTRPAITMGSPSVTSINTGSGLVTYTVTYADANFNLSTLSNGDITLNKTGTAMGNINVTGSGTSYIISISDISGLGSLSISIVAGTAIDNAGNLALATDPSQTFAITQIAQGITFGMLSPKTYGDADFLPGADSDNTNNL